MMLVITLFNINFSMHKKVFETSQVNNLPAILKIPHLEFNKCSSEMSPSE
jgi:hypothetical protein